MTDLHSSSAQSWDWAALGNLCLREAQRILGPSASADDAAQEAVIRAWRRRDRCRTPERPEPWIATIARREALRAGLRMLDYSELPASVAAPDATATRVAELAVRQAVGNLQNDDRILLFARYWCDLTQEDVAATLGLPEGTVKVRLHRVRGALREVLAEH
jgi:RNA polymerase sigma-70 factor (ECF subfamily)